MGEEQRQETAGQKITATAAGVVAGVTLLAAIVGIGSTSSSILAKIASSPPETLSKSAPVVTPQPSLRSSSPKQPKQQSANVSATPRVQSPPAQGKSRILIKANQGSWIDACADGRTLIRRYLPPSNTADLGFSNVGVVRTGNAGGVEISVNGASAGPVGALGEVRVIRFDASGFHLLEQGDPGTECGR
jgi:cytoskeleton protein RodZ